MELRTNVLKLVIGFFLMLNIFTLAVGYYAIDSKFQNNDQYLASTLDYYTRKKDTLLENIDIVKKSKIDTLANIKTLSTETTYLNEMMNTTTNSTKIHQNELQYYQDKLDTLQSENSQLQSKKNNLQTQIDEKNKLQQQQAIMQRQIRVRRMTRTS